MKNNISIKKRAGFIIILIAVIALSLTFTFGGVWFNTFNFNVDNNDVDKIEGTSHNAEISSSVDEDNIFANTYYKALEVLSEGIAYGTTWLDICPNSQIQIDEDIYIKICSDKYSSRTDIVNSVSKYISKDYIDELMGDNFIDYDNSLYIKPVSVNKNEEYIEFVSYRVKEKTSNKIVYSVKSKYGLLDCSNDCNYKYKEHLFELVREGNNWLVSNFEMPY